MHISFRSFGFQAALLGLLLVPPAALAQVPQLLNYQGRIAVNGTNFTGTGQFKFALVDGGINTARTATGTATISGGFLTIVTVTDGGAGYTSAPGVTATGGGGSGAVLTAQITGGSVTSVTVNNPGSGYTSQPAILFAAPGSSLVSRTLWSNNGTSTNGSQPTASVGLPVTKGLYSVLLGDTTRANMTALPATVFTNSTVLLRVWFNDGVSGFQQLSPDKRLAAVGYAIMAGTVPDGSITAAKLAPGAAGTFNYQMANTTNLQAVKNCDYMFTNTGATEVHLPATPAIGDRVRLTANSAGFKIIANSGQSIMNPPSFGWIPRSPFYGLWSVASSSDGSKLVAAAGFYPGAGSIYTSTNFGVTWVQQTNMGSWLMWSVASSSDGSKLVAAANYGFDGSIIYTSTNFGVTWVQQTNAGSSGWMSVASSSDGSKLVAAADYIYTSSNFGVTWVQQTNADSHYWTSVASSSDGSKLVAAANDGNDDGSYIYTSTDYGVTWTQQTNAGSRGWSSVASSSDGSKLVAGASDSGDGDYIYTSSNYGVTWTQQTIAGMRNWNSVASSSDGSKLVAAGGYTLPGDYICTSTDYGVTWTQQLNAGSRGWTSVASSSDGSKVVAGGWDGFLFTMPNYITQWSTVYVYGDAYASIELVYAGAGLWAPTSYSGTFTIE